MQTNFINRELKTAYTLAISGNSDGALDLLMQLLNSGNLFALPGLMLIYAYCGNWVQVCELGNTYGEEFFGNARAGLSKDVWLWSKKQVIRLLVQSYLRVHGNLGALEQSILSWRISEKTRQYLQSKIQKQSWQLEVKFPLLHGQ